MEQDSHATLIAQLEAAECGGREALYFGYGDGGHFLRRADGRTIYRPSKQDDLPGFCWNIGHLDTGLLRNGKHPDRYDGKVFWTCGGEPLWLAFFWWDRSGDSRGNSNSGFYVRGFAHTERAAAFAYACSVFPKVVARQKVPLILVDPPAALRTVSASKEGEPG